MAEVTIDTTKLAEYETAIAELKITKNANTELEAKNSTLSENFKNAKAEAKTKSDKKLLDLDIEKQWIEKELKIFKDTLNIWEVEDLKTHLEGINTDITKYWEVKAQEEIKTKEQIKTYTDFLNEKDWEYLTKQVAIHWEDVLVNIKALENFANIQGFENGTSDWKPLEVWKLTNITTNNPWKSDWFESAYNSWDVNAMNNSIANLI